MQEAYGHQSNEEQYGSDILASSSLSVGAKRRTGEDQFEKIFNQIWDEHL